MIINDKLELSVYYYSFPIANEIVWFENNKIIQNESSVESVIVVTNIHGKMVKLHGFRTWMSLGKFETSKKRLFSCQIRNAYGLVDITFEKHSIEIAIEKSLRTGKLVEVNTMTCFSFICV